MTTLEKLFNNNPAWLLNNDRVDAFAVGVVGLSSYDFRLFLVCSDPAEKCAMLFTVMLFSFTVFIELRVWERCEGGGGAGKRLN